MIIRVLLAAVVTAALLAVSTPAISAAAVERSDATLERQAEELSDRLERMVAADDPTEHASARLVATLRLPGRSLTSAGVSQVRFRRRSGVGLVTWQVGATHRGSRVLVDAALRAVGNPLVLRRAGPHRLSFELEGSEHHPVVTVQRLGGPQPTEAANG